MYITLANSNGAYISILQIQLSQQNSGNQGTRDLAGGYLLRCFFWYGMWLSAPFASEVLTDSSLTPWTGAEFSTACQISFHEEHLSLIWTTTCSQQTRQDGEATVTNLKICIFLLEARKLEHASETSP
jgi:hypothetical protein